MYSVMQGIGSRKLPIWPLLSCIHGCVRVETALMQATAWHMLAVLVCCIDAIAVWD